MSLILENGDAPSNTSTTQVLTVGNIIAGQHSGADTSDWYQVTLTAGTTYTFAMVGTGEDRLIDPFLTLYAPNGSTIRSEDDDGFSNTNARIVFTATNSGTFYIDAGEFSPGGTDYRLSMTTADKALVDDEMIVGAINSAALWASTTVTYAFRTERATYENNSNITGGSNIKTFTVLSAAEEAAVESCLQQYSDVCGLVFEYREPNATGDRATMLFGNYNDPDDGAGAFAYFPGSTAVNSPDGDVWLNTDSVDINSLPQGEYSYFALLHEIGHAMGLSHPGEYNAAPNVEILYENDARFAEDSNQYSIMSYFDGVDTGAQWNQMTSTLMMFDILALQTMYGVNSATRATNTIYGFGSTAGDAFDFDLNPDAIFCIWDGNGTDTIDGSGFTDDQVIDLGDGQFSDMGGQTENVSIAFNADIENANGGSGNDFMTGNALGNVLDGNNGRDTLRGLAGIDTLNGGLGNDKLTGGSRGDTLDGGGGVDTADYVTSRSGVTINLTTNVNTGGDAAGDQLLDIEHVRGSNFADSLTGNAGANNLKGNNGDDTLIGSGGRDTLTGGKGADTLTGGTGDDIFVFDADLVPANADTITDYVAGIEQIKLQNSVFTGLVNGALSANAFVDGLVATRAQAQVLYDKANGDIYFDADGTGNGAAVKFAVVDDNTALTRADFFVI